ncbi:MAG: hypothetical protein PHG66_01940 [Candidatus Colwellbacteria bacterium]|nr:hypothetical protein [Candidatus Colwellbacteria bacterium]
MKSRRPVESNSSLRPTIVNFNMSAPQYSSYAQPIPVPQYEDVLLQRFRDLASQYEISDKFAAKMRQLEGCDISIILDDSSSMCNPIYPIPAFGKATTRWDEEKNITGIVVDIASVMDKDGLEVNFLNRGTLSGISHSSQLGSIFSGGPYGSTPLCSMLRSVITSKMSVAKEKKVIIYIVTDGEPDGGAGDLKRILENERHPNMYVTFVACTSDLSVVAYLNDWDKTIPRVDVVDDYLSEKAEILRVNPSISFTFGDYVVKSLVGAIDSEFDNMDESRRNIYVSIPDPVNKKSTLPIQPTQQCCTIL